MSEVVPQVLLGNVRLARMVPGEAPYGLVEDGVLAEVAWDVARVDGGGREAAVSDASADLGGKNSNENVVPCCSNKSRTCMRKSFYPLIRMNG